MKIKVWGTRGSAPVTGPEFQRYGGDTSCLEVRTNSGDTILLDAGTGINAFERNGEKDGKLPVICLSHAHLDHIQGLPFYSPLYSSKTIIYGPKGLDRQLAHLFDGAFHPIKREQLHNMEIRELESGDSFKIGDAEIEVCATNHPGGCLAYKIKADGTTFTYSGDHEIPLDEKNQDLNSKLMDFTAGSDVVLVDAQYSPEDHASRKGWGHSHIGQWLELLKPEQVGRIYFGHFSPDYTDEDIDRLVQEAKAQYPDINLSAAFSGCEITPEGASSQNNNEDCAVCSFFQKTASLSDTHAVLEAILTEARKLGQADAGTVYLVENGELSFSAAQNDTLFPDSAANKFFYMNSRIPINKSSIAGYVAATGTTLNIADVYHLPKGSEYGFNVDFDKKSGYRTKSVLAVPLLNAGGEVTGVLQLINSLRDGKVVPFTQGMERTISRLASMATVPLERSFLLTSMILRMLRTSALRDPAETAGHVYRVGGIAAELYHRWALEHGVEPETLLATKGMVRLAAMLHDVGKVGIPDAVLKKPGKLDDTEFATMQRHAGLGATLFGESKEGIDKIAKDIALHHHAKWNGKGYTGDSNIQSPQGEDIPVYARITAIADVYDALVSRRCYKDAWDANKAIEILRKDAGTHFDPELVKYFIEIQDTIDAIMKKYQ